MVYLFGVLGWVVGLIISTIVITLFFSLKFKVSPLVFLRPRAFFGGGGVK